MVAYRIEREDDILRVAFGERAQNDQIVKDATAGLEEMYSNGELDGGGLLKVNGPASLPVAWSWRTSSRTVRYHCLLRSQVNKYVVTISHSPKHVIGTWIE